MQQGIAEPGLVEQGLGGLKHSWDRAALGLKGLVTDLTPEDKALLEQGESFVNQTGPASTVGQVAGDIGITAPAFAFGGAATQLPRVVSLINALRKTSPKVAAALGLGTEVTGNAGISAALAPENRGEAAQWGAGGAVAGRVLSKALRGAKPGPEAQKLLDQGITPTYGQVMGEKGAIGRGIRSVEEQVEGIPILGSLLQNQKGAAREAFQKATRQAALPPGLPKAETIDELSSGFRKAYEDTLSSAKVPITVPSIDDLLDGIDVPGATKKMYKQASTFLQDLLPSGDQMTAKAAQQVESKLKARAFQYKGSIDPSQREQGYLMEQIAGNFAEHWRGQLDAVTGKSIAEIDRQFSQFMPVRRAAGKALTEPASYTPKVLLRAIRQGDRSVDKTRFTKGGLPQQELAQAAETVLGSKSLDPGALRGTIGGIGALGSLAVHTPAALIGLGAATVYSTPWVQRFLIGQSVSQKAFERFWNSASLEGRQRFISILMGSNNAVAQQAAE
jgi:hypothetical protein